MGGMVMGIMAIFMITATESMATGIVAIVAQSMGLIIGDKRKG